MQVWRFHRMAGSEIEFLTEPLNPPEASRGQRLAEQLRRPPASRLPKRQPLSECSHRARPRCRLDAVDESKSARPPETNYECPRCGARLLQTRVLDSGGPPAKATCPVCISALPAHAGDYLLEYKLIKRPARRES